MAETKETLENWQPAGDSLRGTLTGGKHEFGVTVTTLPVKTMPGKTAKEVEFVDGQKLALGEPYKVEGEPKPEPAGAASKS